MSRPSRTDAGSCIPRMVPWRDWDEWYRVKALLFSPEPYLRSQGVQHVAVWQSREHIPHAVETTSQLVEARLNDVGSSGGELAMSGARRSEEELRLIYSAVVVRAVNGLTGHEQKSTHAAPVSSLAREIGLPTWIVDIRHEAAHKQLPGIVTLRLASDFLVDYLWRRYWGPQAEHLGFVWGAFDQLISRFKATSESDTSLPPNGGQRRRRAASPAQTSSKKRRTDAPASSGSENPASLKDNAPTGGVGDESSRSKTSRAGNSVLPRSSSSSSSKSATHGATAAMEVAAHEIARSATPSALSWALLSLLADGGVRAESGADGFAGTRRRGQGHLLPRSRDKYPTPGTPGVDTQEVSRRITTRWATLLDMFHVRWRGFGAALLVRLVEALLNNAASPLPSSPPNDTAHPSVAGTSSSGGGSGGGGSLERQATFIEVWVRHLLSRRWHLRGSDARIRGSLRQAAAADGLSPAFCDEQEGSWEEEESAWADKPAPLPVLQAAFFPVRELLDRCCRLLNILPVAAAPAVTHVPPAAAAAVTPRALGDDELEPAGGDTSAPPATSADGARKDDAHWARTGLDAVCRALAEAIPGQNASSDVCDAAATAATAGDDAGAGGSAVGDRSPSSARRELGSLASFGPRSSCRDRSAPDPVAVPTGGGVVGGGGGGGHVGEGGVVSGGDGAESVKSAESTTVTAGAAAAEAAAAASTTMMGLDDLERLLGSEGSSPPGSLVSRDGNGRFPSASTVAVDDDAAAGVVGAESASGLREAARMDVVRTNVVGVNRTPAADRTGGAWEVVETWTPCAIGTLPGWSAARLY